MSSSEGGEGGDRGDGGGDGRVSNNKRKELECLNVTYNTIATEAVRVGVKGYRMMHRMQQSRILDTVFAEKANSIHRDYHHFLPEHCELLSS